MSHPAWWATAAQMYSGERQPTMADLACIFGVCREAVRHALVAQGIPTRKWMPPTGHIVPPRSCALCGAKFHAEHSRNKFCSPKCAQESFRLRGEKRCRQCGAAYNGRTDFYCSMECYTAARREKKP